MAGYCDQCDRHCPLDALRCGRGRRKYGGEQTESRERMPIGRLEQEHRPHDDHHHEEHDHHGRHGHHDEHEHHGGHHDEHEHHGKHGHGPSVEELQDRLETGDLSELMHMCGHVLHRRPEAHAARGQGKILSILADEGAVSQKLLQQALHIQPGSMSEIVTKLENKGLLTRTRGEDRRGNVLTITEEGRRIAQQEDASGEDLFCALTKDQQYQLRSLLQTLLTDWLQRFDPRFHEKN